MNTTIINGRVDRLRRLMEERGYDAVLVRNCANLRWLMGTERVFDYELAHTAVITQEKLWLHTDSRYYNTFKERLGEQTEWQLDMEPVLHPAWAAQIIKQTKSRVVALEDSFDLAFFDALQQAVADQSIACLFPRMHSDILNLRMQKDAEELELMRAAQAITDKAYTHICEFIEPGRTELEIRTELERYMFELGATALAFDSIVAAGPNGANPHAQPSDRKVQKQDMIVLDYGAGYRDYNSDMTRTVCVGTPTAEQQKVYDIVRKAHEECARAAKPGCTGLEIHMLAVKIISDAGYGEYFGHGLGHGVGIDIHERPMFNPYWTQEIPLGSVVTIEPGIYLPQNFGVRLEDFGVMTEQGFEPFTQSSHELVCL